MTRRDSTGMVIRPAREEGETRPYRVGEKLEYASMAGLVKGVCDGYRDDALFGTQVRFRVTSRTAYGYREGEIVGIPSRSAFLGSREH